MVRQENLPAVAAVIYLRGLQVVPRTRVYAGSRRRSTRSGRSRLWPAKQRRCILQYRLHIGWKHVSFVNFQIIDMPAGIVQRHPFIDRSSQGEGRIAFSAHNLAGPGVLGAAAHFEAGDNSSAVTVDEIGAVEASTCAWPA